jgi:hypothetical protein
MKYGMRKFCYGLMVAVFLAAALPVFADGSGEAGGSYD